MASKIPVGGPKRSWFISRKRESPPALKTIHFLLANTVFGFFISRNAAVLAKQRNMQEKTNAENPVKSRLSKLVEKYLKNF